MSKKTSPDIRMVARLIPPSGNLVQGQSEVDLHPALAQALSEVIAEGLNHYSFFEGVEPLRRAVAEKVRRFNKIEVDAERVPYEILITPGATGALVALAAAYLAKRTTILFDPYYPYHRKIIESFDGQVSIVPLHGDKLSLDVDELRLRCSALKSSPDYPLKAILVCSPTNPTGKVFSRQELTAIAEVCEEFDLLCVSDEVYEHFVIAPDGHVSIASLEGMYERTITCNSFSKSWAVSGWRLGYVYGPGELIHRLHAPGNVFYVCTPTPLQHALARVLMSAEGYYDELRRSYTRKRQILTEAVESVGFKVYDSGSAFYLWARIPDGFGTAEELNTYLIEQAQVAGVPGTAFSELSEANHFMRFCFARKDEMLREAASRIATALS
ncbi:MAG: pyridoxal phosphate-dependent aminotransferase [Acidobacteriota bacterium]|nr:pyridoxal phosphate-dependent aminotransferase [Blastocatellia bacterium]MDW8412943.1 pyridoxal phosphate-dependent aminotransferase [Acidobacteriota bacterium]